MNAERTPSDVQSFVRAYYGQALRSSDDLQTNACCASGAPPEHVRPLLANVHPDVAARFYGCGFPIPHALAGAKVLDLGCGTGRDVYVLAQLVGEGGEVHGLDMTEEQLALARETRDWHAARFGHTRPNTFFHHGFIEDLSSAGLADGSMDVIVSNCVVNLSPLKEQVLAEAFRVLAPGGELYLSDVVADRRLPAELANDPVLHAECLGGAAYEADFLGMARRVGFRDPRIVSRAALTPTNPDITRRLGAARFSSVTFRLFKLGGLDDQCEDYGQVAEYLGGIPGAESLYWLDDHHAFEAGRPERVCANTAAMLVETRLRSHFRVHGARTTHFGAFPCLPTMAAAAAIAARGDAAAGSCC